MIQTQPATLLKHPKGLFICFGTELWERFSYYGMRALLIFYLTQHFLLSDNQSYGIYAAYASLAWGLPVIGGILADRYLGARKAVTVGALLLTTGHLLMAIEGPPAIEYLSESGQSLVERDARYLNLFYLSLACIVTGVGFLKTNITTIVGALYSRDDPRRDAGYTIFYLGINLGGAIAPLLCGWLGQTYGWRYGFGLAGIGMLAGLLLFLSGQRYLEGHAEPPDPQRLKDVIVTGINREWLIYGSAVIMILVAWLLLQHYHAVGLALGAFGLAVGAAILYFTFSHCTPTERDRMLVVAALIVVSIVFWALYEQMGSSLNLFADRFVDRSFAGIEVQASQLQALPATFVIFLAPLFTALWTWLGRRRMNPNIPLKFSLGLFMISIAFCMPIVGHWVAGHGERIDLLWFVLIFFFMVCGELLMAPIAMNMISRLCPKRVVGMMMGAYFLSLSIGSYLAGLLATLTSVPADIASAGLGDAIGAYVSSFKIFSLIGLVAGITLLLGVPILARRMHEGNGR